MIAAQTPDTLLRSRSRASALWAPNSSFRRIVGNPAAAVSIGFLLVVVLFAVFPTVIASDDPLVSSRDRFKAPSVSHLMGTDNLGRDMFARVVHGSRTSMQVGFAALTVAIGAGFVLGLASGYVGGWFDLVLQRFMDALVAFPALLLAMALVSVFEPSLRNAIIAIGITLLPGAQRIVRAATMAERRKTYIEAARAIGASNIRIALQHIAPNIVAPILVIASAYLGAAILLEATLGYLGLGAQPPTISWGSILSGVGLRFLESYPWLALFPGLAISLTVLALSMLGDVMRDVLDPRLRP